MAHAPSPPEGHYSLGTLLLPSLMDRCATTAMAPYCYPPSWTAVLLDCCIDRCTGAADEAHFEAHRESPCLDGQPFLQY